MKCPKCGNTQPVVDNTGLYCPSCGYIRGWENTDYEPDEYKNNVNWELAFHLA